MKKKFKFMLLLLLLLVGVLIFFKCNLGDGSHNPLTFLNPDPDAKDWNGNQELPQSGSSEDVAIPGFDSLVCYSNQTKQKVNFYNPEANDCLMRMTLYADEQKLWQSGYIEAGKGYHEIEFTKPLNSGKYEGTLLVECFFKDGTEANKAKVKFKLNVEDK